MLQTIREHTQGWIAAIVISIIILSFALWGVHNYFIGGGTSNIVAEVNGVNITKEQLSIAYERLYRQIQAQPGVNKTFNKNEQALRSRALDALVEIEVLKQSAKNQGFRISNMQTENYLQTIPEFQVEGRFSLDRFQAVLAGTMLSTGEFINLLQTSLLIDQPKLGIIYTSYTLPYETNYAASLINQERELEYIEVPLSYFLSTQLAIPKEKIAEYYKNHQSQFMSPPQVKVNYVELSLQDLSDKMDVTDATLKSFYNDNLNLFTLPKEWKLMTIELPLKADASKEELSKIESAMAEIQTQIKTNADSFNQLATQYPSSLSTDWLSLSQLPEELKKTVASLKPNDISSPIKTASGLMIIKVVDEKAPQVLSFDQVKDKAKQIYAKQKAEEQFAEKKEQLANLSYEHPDSLEDAAKTLNLPIKTSELFSKTEGTGIAQNQKVRDIAFSNDVLNLQNNSDTIQINPQTVVVLHMNNYQAAAQLDLDAVSKSIQDKLTQEAVEVRAKNFVQDIKAKLNANNDPEQIASAYKFTWIKPGYLTRYTNQVDSAILDLAFRLPNPQDTKSKVSYGVIRIPTGYAIVALKSIRKAPLDEKQSHVIAEQMALNQGQLEYQLYKQSEMRAAKIKS